MVETVWTQSYDVNSLVLNPQKRLGLYGLLNLLSDAAWVHADHLGFGYDAMASSGTFWVLTRQAVAMTDWPVWGDRLSVRTWARPFAGARAPRDFELLIGDRKIGEATTDWLILDAARRRPVRFEVLKHPVPARTDGGIHLDAPKIPVRGDLSPSVKVCVRYGDLDVNGHVGNTRYAQWALDAMAPATPARTRIDGYAVNFLAETRLGDEIVVETGPAEAGPDGLARQPFQGRRLGDGKIVFSAWAALAANA